MDIHQFVFSFQIKYFCSFHEQIKPFYGCSRALSSISPAACKAEHFVLFVVEFFVFCSSDCAHFVFEKLCDHNLSV